MFGLKEENRREEKMNVGEGKMWVQVIDFLTNLVNFLFHHATQTTEMI